MLRSSGIVSVATFLSRILGLVRDVALARFLGAEAGADAFFIAFKIPNFFRRLFAEGAFSQAFVPVLNEWKIKQDHDALKGLVNRVAGVLGAILLLFTVLAVWGAPWVATLFAPGFIDQADKFALVTELIRITFPYLMLISLTGFAGAVLNSFDQFAIPAITPLGLNICLISAAILVSPSFDTPAFALAWGVLAAGVVQLLLQLPFLMRLNLLPKPQWDWGHPGVRRIMTLMVPALFGVSVSQINLLLDTVLASFLPTGSVAWLYYSDRLSELPLGVFAIAISTVILPNLSRLHASDSQTTFSNTLAFSNTLDWGLRLIILIGVPSSVALLLLAEPILTTLFLYGKTTAQDIAMASLSLRAYALGLLAFMLIKVLAPGFYARQDMKTPVRIGVIAMVVNMGLNLLFVIPLHLYWKVGHMGLALATAGSAFLNAGLLYRALRQRGIYQPRKGWLRVLIQQLVANGVMAACLIGLLVALPKAWGLGWEELHVWQRVLSVSMMCVAGFLAYLMGLLMAGWRLKLLRASI